MQERSEAVEMPSIGSGSYTVLLPSAFGLTMAAMVVNLAIQQAHRTTDVSTYAGWSMIASCILAGALFFSTFFIKRFSKRSISLMVFLSIHLAGLSALAFAFAETAGLDSPPVFELLLQAGMTSGATLLEFYWLRKLRGTSAQAVVVVVFSALALSEFATFLLSFWPSIVWHFACVVLMFAQFLTVRVSRKLGVPSDTFPAVSESYFGTDENHFSNRSFLATAALGIWFISIPLGMGRGFSMGHPIFMDTIPRFLTLFLVCVVSFMWIRYGLASRMRALTTSIWVAIELLLGLGAIFFTVWPLNVAMGASFVMASALVLQAFVWYMTIAFISFGWRDPYYYCCAAWVAMNLLALVGMKADGFITALLPANTPAVVSIMSFFVLVSTQIVFTRLLSSPSERQLRELAQAQVDELTRKAGPGDSDQAPKVVTEDDVRRIPLMGVLAISPQAEVPMVSKTPDVHIATSVMEMGQRFGLTGREVEVLTLYALGHTQVRVSEELQLSTNTVHTHIKRIYEKTDLHSRQEILDYITEYGK